MHRAIGYLSKRLVQVRAGEGRKVLLTFLYFFLVITAYYVIKPVSRALVLDDLGSRLVPYVDLISAILMGPMVTLFARLVDRIEKRRLVTLTFWAVAGCLLVFWKFLQWPDKWVAAAFYVWVAIFSVLVVTLFWLVANDLYHPREAKRLFGFIGAGGILGGVVGSSIAAAGARLVGTNQLLLLSASILLFCWLVVRRLWRYAPSAIQTEQASEAPREPFLANLGASVRLLVRSRYLVLLVGLVGIAKIVSTFIYYQFNPFIEQMFPDEDAKTAFMGLFFGWINLASFVVQFFFTSWILRRLGLACALVLLPLGVLAGSMGLLVMPMFWVAATTELYDHSLNYSLQQTTKEVLYLPIDRSVRYKVKPFIDMVVFRFGKGIAAIIGIVLLDLLHLEARTLSYLSIPLIVVWIALVFQLRHDYVKTIRGILQARAASRRGRQLEAALELSQRLPATESEGQAGLWSTRESEELDPSTPSLLAGSLGVVPSERSESRDDERLESLVPGSPVHQKLILASQLFAINGTLAEGGEELLEELRQYEQRPGTSQHVGSAPSLERLKECLSDSHEPMPTRRYAIKQLVQRDGQEAVDCLLGMLMVEEDSGLRDELIRGLSKLRLRHPHGLEFPKRLIRRQIAKEVQAYQRIAQIAAIYRHRAGTFPACAPARPVSSGAGGELHEAGRQQSDPVLGLLRLLIEEAAQQIFCLLSLVYRPEDIYLVYNQLREPDVYVRADAIELLDNLIDPAFRWLIFPVLDEDRFLGRLDRQLDEPAPDLQESLRLLRQGIWDHNRWLSLLSICVVGRLRAFQPLLPELDRAAQSQVPVVSLAAKVARRLGAEPTPA